MIVGSADLKRIKRIADTLQNLEPLLVRQSMSDAEARKAIVADTLRTWRVTNPGIDVRVVAFGVDRDATFPGMAEIHIAWTLNGKSRVDVWSMSVRELDSKRNLEKDLIQSILAVIRRGVEAAVAEGIARMISHGLTEIRRRGKSQ